VSADATAVTAIVRAVEASLYGPSTFSQADLEGEWSELDKQTRLRSDDPKFLVQGTVIAWGGEGEPLLEKPRVVGGFPSADLSPTPR